MEDIRYRFFIEPLEENQGQFLLESIASGLLGLSYKRILFGLGRSDAGKSTVSNALSYTIGNYFGTFSAENLCVSNSSTDEAAKLRWMLLLRFKRIIVSNEMKQHMKIDVTMLKKASRSKDGIQARFHGGNETCFYPQFLAISFANDCQGFNCVADDAVTDRPRVVDYFKKYLDNPDPTNPNQLKKNNDLEKEFCTLEFQQALVALLIKTFIEMKKRTGKTMPRRQ
jgi:hypothetical protein